MRELRRRRENVKEIKRSGPAEKTQVSRSGANVQCGGLHLINYKELGTLLKDKIGLGIPLCIGPPPPPTGFSLWDCDTIRTFRSDIVVFIQCGLEPMEL
ncbi:hypothetical protein C1H46_009569 [Malus baccata]|uniref:Uncharacterized protein n=1 Tax=Malus baccata TaxID=106549 RepID=A0A540N1F5_MALBA|nr:hypothetical protein C1H46_009569 [Malus baccata]